MPHLRSAPAAASLAAAVVLLAGCSAGGDADRDSALSISAGSRMWV